MEEIAHEGKCFTFYTRLSDSPSRQNRISPKRYDRRTQPTNRAYVTHPREIVYDDEDEEVVSKQPADYFPTNDDIVDSEFYGKVY